MIVFIWYNFDNVRKKYEDDTQVVFNCFDNVDADYNFFVF